MRFMVLINLVPSVITSQTTSNLAPTTGSTKSHPQIVHQGSHLVRVMTNEM